MDIEKDLIVSNMDYIDFLKGKVVISENYGFRSSEQVTAMLYPHQQDVVKFCISGGRRAIFMSFGLGKTFVQLEIAKHIIAHTGKPFLIAMPLAVVGEFKRDHSKLGLDIPIHYVTDTDNLDMVSGPSIVLTNYERIRKGDIDASMFGGVSFDEASVLRNLKTQTTNYVLSHFKQVPYRFVATATPTPNDFIEILNYAQYLGVIDRGYALTRFFQRDSTKAGHLTLYPHKKAEFWQWVATWAAFLETPADLGYDATGYDLPPVHIHDIEVHRIIKNATDKYGNKILFKDNVHSLSESSKEKRDSIDLRCQDAMKIIAQHPNENIIIWHHLEDERRAMERLLSGCNYRSVYGSQPNSEKETNLIDFSEGKYQYLITKPSIAGSGCNLQHHCHMMIFLGISYKFNDHIQAWHRVYRYGQQLDVIIYRLYTTYEQKVLNELNRKRHQHLELQYEMTNLVKDFGFNTSIIKSTMERQIFDKPQEVVIGDATLYNDDSCQRIAKLPTDSIDLIVTSIPFGDHYEYSDNYNDLGHNHGNGSFFDQMNFLTPALHNVLKPGRIAAIHVKDRIRYSYQNGTSFTTIDDFSGDTVRHFKSHGFHLIGKITVTTDVVRENNQTYRLGYSEQCKDASKMGVGLPEYILLFRKPPSTDDNSYADNPVNHSKDDYSLSRWQLDAHAYHRSSGDRFMMPEEIGKRQLDTIMRRWKDYNGSSLYNFKEHIASCDDLENADKLSRQFMTLAPISNSDLVWDDVNRMRTLNTDQARRRQEKHICPLQLDIIERLVTRYSTPGEVILDPFMGIGSTAYVGILQGRKAIGCELNNTYWSNSIGYVKAAVHKMQVPTLFDAIA